MKTEITFYNRALYLSPGSLNIRLYHINKGVGKYDGEKVLDGDIVTISNEVSLWGLTHEHMWKTADKAVPKASEADVVLLSRYNWLENSQAAYREMQYHLKYREKAVIAYVPLGDYGPECPGSMLNEADVVVELERPKIIKDIDGKLKNYWKNSI